MTEENTLPGSEETPDAGNGDGENNSSQNGNNANANDSGNSNTSQQDTKPKAPEKYEFKAPEGVELNKEILSEFEELARAADMSNEDAQKYVDLQIKNMTSWAATAEAAQKKQIETWKADIEKDEILKDPANRAIAQKALEGYTEKLPESMRSGFSEFLESGVIYHPGFVRFLYAIGKDISDDNYRDGDPSKNKDTREKQLSSLYPTSVNKAG